MISDRRILPDECHILGPLKSPMADDHKLVGHFEKICASAISHTLPIIKEATHFNSQSFGRSGILTFYLRQRRFILKNLGEHSDKFDGSESKTVFRANGFLRSEKESL